MDRHRTASAAEHSRVNRHFFVILFAVATVARAQAPGDFPLPFRADLAVQPGTDVFEITELSPAVYLDEVGGETRALVQRAEQFLEAEQWSEAIEIFMRLSESNATELIESPFTVRQDEAYAVFVPVKTYVRQRLASLDEAARPALRIYRDRVDPLCRQWLEKGIADRDVALLRKVAEEYFNGSHADEALWALGELALEQGHFDRARGCWRAIHPGLDWVGSSTTMPYWQQLARGVEVASLKQDLQSNQPRPHAYQGGDVELPDLWARLVLTSILERNRRRAAVELRLLRELWPDAEGVLAGRNRNYVDALTQLHQRSGSWPRVPGSRDWPTFAGDHSRQHQSETTIDIPLTPSWTAELDPTAATESELIRTFGLPIERAGEDAEHPRAHFPIVVGNLVLIHDGRDLRCLDLDSGGPAWGGGPAGIFYSSPAPRARAAAGRSPFGDQVAARLGQPRYTLSASGETLVATMGAYDAPGASRNAIMLGFDLAAEGASRFGPVRLDENWTFQGAPVCDDVWCWVGLRHRQAAAREYVACYELRGGREVWRTRVCAAETLGHGAVEETTHQLLTYHEDTLYYGSNLGAIVAISAHDGAIRWLTTYPRRGPERGNLLDEPWYVQRDLTPCLFHAGLIIAAPQDCETIFALDADTGRLIWQTAIPRDATQLLGVGEDHLMVSGRRLWFLDVFTGRLSQRVDVNPFPPTAFSQLRGAGRGLLAGGNVYWPTQGRGQAIYVLSQRSGQLVRQPIDLTSAGVPAGNLFLARDHLLVAGPDTLSAFRLAP